MVTPYYEYFKRIVLLSPSELIQELCEFIINVKQGINKYIKFPWW